MKEMKKLLFILAFLFTSITIFANPVERLKKLADKVECGHKEFTDKDWDKIANEYNKIVDEFNKEKHTKEELKEFGRQRGRIKGYMTKKTLKKWSNQVEEYANELGGGIKGFFETIGDFIDE